MEVKVIIENEEEDLEFEAEGTEEESKEIVMINGKEI